tara:strand:+ start:6112 stop:7614 length:1503 start_codon:yes stop_codon:yes gene_type:complete
MLNQGGGPSGYEAAKTSQNRSTIDLTIQNARQDIDKFTRREILRKVRYLYRNSPITRGLIERLVTYTIGTGLHPTPTTSDERFNAAAELEFKNWSKFPDIESKTPFRVLQSVIFRSMLIDGDIFSVKTFGSFGFPRLQMIESHDITSKKISSSDEPDGVILDAFDRPIQFVWKEEERISADSVIQFFIPERVGQKRGISILHSVVNTAHDIDDILALEKVALKDGSSKTDIIKTASGELPSDDYIGESMKPADATTGDEEVSRFYREMFGPEAKVLKHGDEFTPYASNRPSQAFQGFLVWLAENICFGTGLPPSLLLGTKVGGADTRREVATAQRVIDQWQQILISGFQSIYEYVIEQAILDKRLPPPPNDWKATEWDTPPKLTVDAGREADSDREDVKLGLLTRREYFKRWGLDWKEQTEQKAKEAQFINEMARQYGVDPAEISLLDPNELAAREGGSEEAKVRGRKVSMSQPKELPPLERNEQGRFMPRVTVSTTGTK